MDGKLCKTAKPSCKTGCKSNCHIEKLLVYYTRCQITFFGENKNETRACHMRSCVFSGVFIAVFLLPAKREKRPPQVSPAGVSGYICWLLCSVVCEDEHQVCHVDNAVKVHVRYARLKPGNDFVPVSIRVFKQIVRRGDV